jgi:hypothetical protein
MAATLPLLSVDSFLLSELQKRYVLKITISFVQRHTNHQKWRALTLLTLSHRPSHCMISLMRFSLWTVSFHKHVIHMLVSHHIQWLCRPNRNFPFFILDLQSSSFKEIDINFPHFITIPAACVYRLCLRFLRLVHTCPETTSSDMLWYS